MHTDQGFQRFHPSRRRLLDEAGCAMSMSRKVTYLDNVIAEGFFGQIKERVLHHTHYATTEDVAAELDQYMPWCNCKTVVMPVGGADSNRTITERIRLRLEGLSPAECRAQTLKA